MLAAVRSIRPLSALAVFVATGMLATHTVDIAPGDTLTQIASEHGVTVAQLVAWNDIADADLIFAGETLVVRVDREDGSPTTYLIRPGDTLSAIAGRFGTTIGALAAANGLADPDHIVSGHLLSLEDQPDETDSPATGTSTYEVRAGDTLLGIARAHGLKTATLVTVNGLADPDRIFEGQLLTIPADDSDPTPPTTTTPSTTAPSTTTTTAPPTTTTPTTTTPSTTTTTAPPTTTTAPPATTTAPSSPPSPGSGTGLASFFEKWSDSYGVDRSLLEALLWKESNWRADAVGPDGQLGIGQLNPDTVAFVEQRLLGLDLDPLDASDGIQMAARYLRYLADRTPDERTALAAWNQGLDGVNADGVSAGGGAFADSVLEIRANRS